MVRYNITTIKNYVLNQRTTSPIVCYWRNFLMKNFLRFSTSVTPPTFKKN